MQRSTSPREPQVGIATRPDERNDTYGRTPITKRCQRCAGFYAIAQGDSRACSEGRFQTVPVIRRRSDSWAANRFRPEGAGAPPFSLRLRLHPAAVGMARPCRAAAAARLLAFERQRGDETGLYFYFSRLFCEQIQCLCVQKEPPLKLLCYEADW